MLPPQQPEPQPLPEVQRNILDILGERRLRILSDFLREVCDTGWGSVEVVIYDGGVRIIRVKSVK